MNLPIVSRFMYIKGAIVEENPFIRINLIKYIKMQSKEIPTPNYLNVSRYLFISKMEVLALSINIACTPSPRYNSNIG